MSRRPTVKVIDAALKKQVSDLTRNAYADLLLTPLRINRHTVSYRRLRAAIVLCSFGKADPTAAYEQIACLEGSEPANVTQDIYSTLSALPRPPLELLAGCIPADRFGICHIPPHTEPDDIVCYLGVAIMLVIYNKEKK